MSKHWKAALIPLVAAAVLSACGSGGSAEGSVATDDAAEVRADSGAQQADMDTTGQTDAGEDQTDSAASQTGAAASQTGAAASQTGAAASQTGTAASTTNTTAVGQTSTTAAGQSDWPAEQAAVIGPYGSISVMVPDTWTWEAVPLDSDQLMYGLYGLILQPKEAEDGHIELFCTDGFGVCGTGLEQKEMTLGGMAANVGYYDGNKDWFFISFRTDGKDIVAQHTDCSSWTEGMWEEAMTILDTIALDPDTRAGGIGQFIQESENTEISLFMEVTNITPSGASLRLHRFEQTDAGPLFYGNAYMLLTEQDGAWVGLPTVIDNAAFTEEAYSIPSEGDVVIEIDWEWLYGQLPPGTYRIHKSIQEETGDGIVDHYFEVQFLLT